MINLLLDSLPKVVSLYGRDYPIASDFRTSVRFELLIQESGLSDEELIAETLRLYYPQLARAEKYGLAGEAVRKALWFYGCGKEEIQEADGGDGESSRTAPGKRAYSFAHDDGYIYAAFLECYGIDLRRVKYLHWWRFRALFKALPDDCQFMKIVGYRSIKVSAKMSKEQKAFYRKMQRLYALPQSDEETQQTSALIEALKNGGDLTGLV